MEVDKPEQCKDVHVVEALRAAGEWKLARLC